MERIYRRTRSQHEAIARLLSAVAVSLVLHAAIAWFAPAPQFSGDAISLQARITLQFAKSSPAWPVSMARSEPNVPLLESIGAGRRGFQLSGSIDSSYYPTSELDVFPAPRVPIRLADNFSFDETVRVLAKIDASGRVTETRIFDSDASGAENVAAMNAIMRTPFQPARRNGRKVRSEIVIEVASR